MSEREGEPAGLEELKRCYLWPPRRNVFEVVVFFLTGVGQPPWLSSWWWEREEGGRWGGRGSGKGGESLGGIT